MAALLGRYELLRPIAKGGMATVYLARVVGEGGFERLVALKLMHPHIASEPDFVSMFLDEARLAARIRHPNVVPTLAVERGDDGLFLVLEYIEGHALSTIVGALSRRRAAFPLEVTLRILADTLEGLHAAHELVGDDGAPLHLVHRDVSPHNVLVGKDGVSRITDFGVAHARARLATTQGASLKGKVAYLSPEQITSGQVDRRCDLFAAGIVLWEALTLRRLFRGETEGQTLAQIIAGAARSPREVNPDVPEPISDVCMKALASSPERRFQTAIEMVDALEAAARTAGLEMAKPRDVGTFLAELKIPQPSADGGKLPSSSSSINVGSRSQPASSTAVPMVASTPAPEAHRRRSPLLALGALAVVLAAVAAFLAFRMTARSDAKAPATQPVAQPSVPARADPSATPSAAAAAPSANAEPAVAASATPEAGASPEPSAEPEATPKPASVGGTMVKKTSPAKPPSKGSVPKGTTGYRPDEL